MTFSLCFARRVHTCRLVICFAESKALLLDTELFPGAKHSMHSQMIETFSGIETCYSLSAKISKVRIRRTFSAFKWESRLVNTKKATYLDLHLVFINIFCVRLLVLTDASNTVSGWIAAAQIRDKKQLHCCSA